MKWFKGAALAALAILMAACATSALVNAERGLKVSLDTVAEVVQTDYDAAAPCRASAAPVTKDCSTLEAAVPGAHKVANDLRTVFPPVLNAGNAAVGVYRAALATQAAIKASATATAQQKAQADADVQAALVAMNTALAKVAVYVTQAEGVWAKWKGGTR